MELTRKEYELILKTEKAVQRTHSTKIFSLIVIIVLFGVMIIGALDTETYAYLSVVLILFVIASPFAQEPTYEQLVVLLKRVKENSEVEPSHIDPIIEALIKK